MSLELPNVAWIRNRVVLDEGGPAVHYDPCPYKKRGVRTQRHRDNHGMALPFHEPSKATIASKQLDLEEKGKDSPWSLCGTRPEGVDFPWWREDEGMANTRCRWTYTDRTSGGFTSSEAPHLLDARSPRQATSTFLVGASGLWNYLDCTGLLGRPLEATSLHFTCSRRGFLAPFSNPAPRTVLPGFAWAEGRPG